MASIQFDYKENKPKPKHSLILLNMMLSCSRNTNFWKNFALVLLWESSDMLKMSLFDKCEKVVKLKQIITIETLDLKDK